MFQAPRQLFHRSNSAPATGDSSPRSAADAKAQARSAASQSDRHPAMRGIDVSPVHGRHCICQRCDQHRDVA